MYSLDSVICALDDRLTITFGGVFPELIFNRFLRVLRITM